MTPQRCLERGCKPGDLDGDRVVSCQLNAASRGVAVGVPRILRVGKGVWGGGRSRSHSNEALGLRNGGEYFCVVQHVDWPPAGVIETQPDVVGHHAEHNEMDAA